MDQGDLIPDDMVMEMVGSRLTERDTSGRGFVLDGCPRTTNQAEHLEKIVQPSGLDLVVDLQVPTSLVMKRLASRRVCVDCGANYSTAAPPLVNWTCDVCGGEVVQRQDDTEEAIERRLNLYEEETAPLLDLVPEARTAGRGQRHRVARRRDPSGRGRHRRAAAQGSGRGQGSGADGMRRNEDELNKMRRAGKVVAEMHEKTREAAKPGVTTLDLDQVARDVLDRRGATSNFLNYHGFPAVICTSPNNMIVHGIPGGYVLEEGDILSIDCGAIIEGYHGDAAFTMGIGTISKEAQKLIEVTERSLWAGIEQMVKGNAPARDRPGRPGRGRGGGLQRGARVRGARHRDGHARAAPGAQLLAGHEGSHHEDGQRLRRRAHGQRRLPRDGHPRRQLERGDGRRGPVGPLRAHHRRDARRARGLHRALTGRWLRFGGDGRAGPARCWNGSG